MDFIDQAKAILESSKKQPDDMCQNVDTIYSDIMKKSNYKIEGISDSILESYIAAENKADFESLFYLLTGVTFEYYLHKCEGTIQRNVAETELRIIQNMKYVLYHEKVVMELYNKVFCQNLKNPKSLTLEILEGTANQLGIFAIEINQFYILTDDATRFSLGYRDFRKIVNYYGYRIYRKTTASGDECYRFVFSEKLLEHYN